MSSRRMFVHTILLGVALVVSLPALAENFAILIGVADYPSGINDLNYTDDDALGMRDQLLKAPGWIEENVILLLNEAATKGAVLSALTAVLTASSPEDLLLFFFAGHGTVMPDQAPIDEADGVDELLCLYGSRNADWLSDDELEGELAYFSGLRVTVVVDACFAGGDILSVRSVNEGEAPDSGDGFGEDLERLQQGPMDPQDLDNLDQTLVALAACRENEYAWELGPPHAHGLFTLYMLDALGGAADESGNRDAWVSAEEIHAYVEPLVVAQASDFGFEQHPQILDLADGELPIMRSLANAPTAALAVAPTSGVAPCQVWLDPASSAAVSGHTLVSYDWALGDGNTATALDPSVVQHLYVTDRVEQAFEVQLIVTDDSGLQGRATGLVTVSNAPPIAGFEVYDALSDASEPVGGTWITGDVIFSDVSGTEATVWIRSAPPVGWAQTTPNPNDGSAPAPSPMTGEPANSGNRNLSYDPEGQGWDDGAPYGWPNDGWGISRYEIAWGDGTQDVIPYASGFTPDGTEGLRIPHTYAMGSGVAVYTLTVRVVDYLGASALLTRDVTLTAGGAACEEQSIRLDPAGWHMIAIPGVLCENCTTDPGALCCALCDDVTPCYIYRYAPQGGGYKAIPPCDAIPSQVGSGLWIRTYQPGVVLRVDVHGPGTSVVIPIMNGWNQIGNPFPQLVPLAAFTVRHAGEEVNISEAHARGWVSQYMFSYAPQDGGYTMLTPASDAISPWQALWFRAYVDCELRIPSAVPGVAVQDLLESKDTGSVPELPLPPPPPSGLPTQMNLPPRLGATNIPNPVRSEHTTTFEVVGPLSDQVDAIRVEIFNLGGQLLWQHTSHASTADWHTQNDQGALVANGVYLSRVWARIKGFWIPTEVRKIAVIR